MARIATDATERFTTGLKTAIETNGNDLGTDGEKTNDGFEEDADDMLHSGGGIRRGRVGEVGGAMYVEKKGGGGGRGQGSDDRAGDKKDIFGGPCTDSCCCFAGLSLFRLLF